MSTTAQMIAFMASSFWRCSNNRSILRVVVVRGGAIGFAILADALCPNVVFIIMVSHKFDIFGNENNCLRSINNNQKVPFSLHRCVKKNISLAAKKNCIFVV